MSEEGMLQKIIKLLSGDKPQDLSTENTDDKNEAFLQALGASTSIAKAMMGAVGGVWDFYFPPDLIGGCCPRVVGEEEDIAWNAAAEAADTERVHIVWQSQGDKIWYLAVRSDDMASHPGTWCPFASLLPGMNDAVEPPTIYTYFSDETATMMTVLKDGLQIHRGTTSVIRAKSERISRELGGASIIELIPDKIKMMAPVPWYSVSLFEARARRVLATLGVLSAILFGCVAILIWLIGAMATVTAHADFSEITQRTEQKSLQLMRSVEALKASPLREQVAKFAEVNDGLLTLNGFLDVYIIKGNRAEWRALLPPNVTSDRIRELGAQTLDATPQGTVIGTSRDALTLGQERRR